ncbi:putative F-box protein-like [Dorcoceras hygrometricum]|uniref:Putative F-box protein-like n=1 Tax=Dorcoceras hygrometricum TaxID=472368 RepID=A0A2Z7B3J3_9LAMI|nr:putative F-box protein-like [Dorcoceras hygrometricum]
MTMLTSPQPTSGDSTAEKIETTGFSALPPHIIESLVLTRLDGPALASASSCSATLHRLASQNHLWAELCHSTWPSTGSARVGHIISTFPGGGPRAFFSHAFASAPQNLISTSTAPPSELISAVDIHYKDELILSKHQETESVSDWFRCSPFRIDLLEPKEFVPTPVKQPDGDETCTDIVNSMTLSWILIDPIERRAVNLSSRKPVTVQRHWLTGEVKIKFASILAVENSHLLCSAAVTCGSSDCGKMQVMEVSLEMEDMDGVHLNGKDSLVILHRALEGKNGSEGKLSYEDYLEMRRERKERKVKTEEALDMFCFGFGISILVTFLLFLFCI